VLIVPTDVSMQTQCKNLIDETIKAFGKLDILVLNAGVSLHSLFEDVQDLKQFHSLMNVNYFGYLYCTYYALPHLKRSRGNIGVVCSLSGEIGLPLRTGYCASKFAVRGFFESLRTELPADSVHITIISPGSVRTNMREHSLQTSDNIEFNEPDSKKMPADVRTVVFYSECFTYAGMWKTHCLCHRQEEETCSSNSQRKTRRLLFSFLAFYCGALCKKEIWRKNSCQTLVNS